MIQKQIKLFDHNEKAYSLLEESLKHYPIAFIEHATGTGKSFILLKYLYTQMKNKRILFVSMHDEMFEQLFNEQMPILGISKEEFNKFDTLIYHNIPKQNVEELVENYDCIIFDEAHHCGAPQWGENIKKIKELILKESSKKIIGTTATSIRYLDNNMDVSKEFFDNKVASRLPISTAILDNLLPAPLYINSSLTLDENLQRVRRKLNKVPFTQEIIECRKKMHRIEEEIKEESSIPNLLKQYDVKPGEKYIVFCKDLDDLKRKKIEAEEWFKDIGPIEIFEAHSNQKKIKNKEQISKFSENREKISLMFAVDIFNEGFHINNLDGILMFRSTKSPIIYFQQLGRALSFSSRKRQVKIFDFANNLSNCDVVYELYKELIREVKLRLNESPDKEQLYSTILSRFKVIDYTVSILDELNKIESLVDEKYLIKDRIENAILKLEEYRYYYPEQDFMNEYLKKNIDYEYISAFMYIKSQKDYLTIQNIDRLHKLNIDFDSQINMPKIRRKILLKGNNTFHELKEKQLQSFQSRYIDYCLKNNVRPSLSDNPEERNLYNEYRFYLENLTKRKLLKILNNIPFEHTIEEEIILGRYPNDEEIKKYIIYLQNKVNNFINLDSLEIKILRKLKNKIEDFSDLKYYVQDSISINSKIENAIETLANIDHIENVEKILKAYSTIEKYSKRITTQQFEKLLKLNIELPKDINMTLEERIKILGEFKSFYEKNETLKNSVVDKYINFIKTNGRRPNRLDDKEYKLKQDFEMYLENTSSSKVREICMLINSQNIELNFFEKAIMGMQIEKIEIEKFFDHLRNKIKNNEDISKKEIKILFSLNRLQKTKVNNIFVDIVKTYYKLCEKIKNLDEKFKDYKNDISFIRSKYKFITKGILARLEERNIEVSSNLYSEVMSLNDSLCLYEKEKKEFTERITKVKKYIQKYKIIPKDNLYIEYRMLLSSLSPNELKKFLLFLEENNVEFGIEERILNKQFIEDEIRYYISVVSKKNYLDKLENKILDILERKKFYKKETPNKDNEKELSFEERIIQEIKLEIQENPSKPISHTTGLVQLSLNNYRKLEIYRINLLANSIFETVLHMLELEKKELIHLSNQDIVGEFKKISKSSNLEEKNILLLEKIKELDDKYRLESQNLFKDKIISKYIDFVINNINAVPSKDSEEEYEQKLAYEFERIYKYLTDYETKFIETKIKENLKSSINIFYNRYINFINTNGRFPCGNSPISEERYLNKTYPIIASEFSMNEKSEIQRLRKIYTKATIEANLNFSKSQKI